MNNHRKAHEERIKDSFYSCLGEAHVNNLLEDLEENKEAVQAVEVPTSLDNWFETYNTVRKQSAKQEQHQGISRHFMYRAASLVGVVLVLAAVFTLSAENFRSRLISEVVQVVEQSSDTSDYEPTYLPVGYRLDRVVRLGDDSEILLFSNDRQEILQLTIQTIEGDLPEPSMEAVVNSGQTLYVWQDANNRYTLLGEIAEGEVLKIAESVGNQ